MEIGLYLIVGIYFAALSYITLYCLLQLHLLFHYKKNKNQNSAEELDSTEELPFVTVQLPIYNEQYVLNRLVDNICNLDYPKDRFEIHILDDSNDDTLDLAKAKVEEYRAKGYNIRHITREDRKGYKAGALKDGMKFVKGEFIAIFDADFLPKPDFLMNTIPHFKDKNVGIVQTRWGHINQNYSLLTELQAFQLNVHFTVEQLGRQKANYLLQFNGTAGVWRRQTIDEAGGWEADTLTEDLDLSYRAQLKGWKIVYLEDILSPAELPSEMHGLKSQQFRWMKGGAETAVKILPSIWKSHLGFQQKLHATGHLMGSSVFIFVFLLGVFSVPLLYYKSPMSLPANIQSLFLISLVSIIGVYYVANVQTAWKGSPGIKRFLKFLIMFPLFLSLSMGLSFHNTLAVLQGYLGKKSAFVRTPKFNITNLKDRLINKSYLSKKLGMSTLGEGLLALYFCFAVYLGYSNGDYSLMLFHVLLTLGYSTIFYFSVKHLSYS